MQAVLLRDVVDINPPRMLQRGESASHVSMGQLAPFSRSVRGSKLREFTGSGSRFCNEDTLVARITPCLENGKTVFVDFLADGAVGHGSTEFLVLAAKEGITCPLFVYYLARSDGFRRFASQQMEGSSGRQRVPSAALGRYRFCLPALESQKEITRILGAIDDKIELNRQSSCEVEGIAAAVFHFWFVDCDAGQAKAEGRRPSCLGLAVSAFFPDSFRDSLLGPIPKGWEIRTLPEVVEVNPWRSLKKGAVAPYVGMKSMPTQGCRPSSWIGREFTSGTRFTNGDTLLARITPCLENGKTAFVNFLDEGAVGWGSTEYIVFRTRPPLPPEYAYFLARSRRLRDYATANMVGSSGRQRVPTSCFDNFPIVVPDRAVAAEFGRLASAALNVVRRNHEESKILASIRDALLPKLLSGELHVSGVETCLGGVGGMPRR